MSLTFGSLFSGIGGMDLGLERAGLKCLWQVELNGYATTVLEKHWPGLTRHKDIRRVDWSEMQNVDAICGGFPCQDISSAGCKKGIAGSSSGLWKYYLKAIHSLRPPIVLIENVAEIVSRGLSTVITDLAGIGYVSGWRTLCSSEFGFPFMRRRLFMVACPYSNCKPISAIYAKVENMPKPTRDSWRRSLQRLARNHGTYDGIPNRVERCRGIGNAVIPRIAEWIGTKLLEAINQ